MRDNGSREEPFYTTALFVHGVEGTYPDKFTSRDAVFPSREKAADRWRLVRGCGDNMQIFVASLPGTIA